MNRVRGGIPNHTRHSADSARIVPIALLGMLLAAMFVAQPAAAQQIPETVSFDTLLTESHLTFQPPPGGTEIPPHPVPGFSFQKGLYYAEQGVQLHVAVRPLARMRIDYDDPHSSAPEPDHVFPLVFASLTGALAGTKDSRSREFPAEKAKSLFNAHWAAAAIFDLDPALSGGYRTGLLLAMHKSRKGDAYSLFLFNDPEASKAFLSLSQAALKFIDG